MTDQTPDPIPAMPLDAAVGDVDRPLTPAQAAAWLNLQAFGYDVGTLLRWAMEGKIEHVHIGHRVAFLREHLVRFTRAGTPIDSPLRALKKVTRNKTAAPAPEPAPPVLKKITGRPPGPPAA